MKNDTVVVTAPHGLWLCGAPNQNKIVAVPKGTNLRLRGERETTPGCEWELVDVLDGEARGKCAWVCKSEKGEQYIALCPPGPSPKPEPNRTDPSWIAMGIGFALLVLFAIYALS